MVKYVIEMYPCVTSECDMYDDIQFSDYEDRECDVLEFSYLEMAQRVFDAIESDTIKVLCDGVKSANVMHLWKVEKINGEYTNYDAIGWKYYKL